MGCNFRLRLKIRNNNPKTYVLLRGLSIFRLFFGIKYLGKINDETSRDDNGSPKSLSFSPIPSTLIPSPYEAHRNRSSLVGGETPTKPDQPSLKPLRLYRKKQTATKRKTNEDEKKSKEEEEAEEETPPPPKISTPLKDDHSDRLTPPDSPIYAIRNDPDAPDDE